MRFFIFAISASFLVIFTPSTSRAQVDLSVTNITQQKENIRIRVKNVGKTTAPATQLNIWFVDNDTGKALDNKLKHVNALNPGSTVVFNLKIPRKKLGRVRHLLMTVKVDPATRIPESNERNNLMQKVFRVGAEPKPVPAKPVADRLPDLRVKSIAKRGDDFVITVVNNGDSRSNACILATWANDVELKKWTRVNRYVPALNAGESKLIHVDRIPKPKGNIKVSSIIDVRKKVKEHVENNNTKEVTFSAAKPVTGTADLIVSKIDFPSPNQVEVTIRNQGSGSTRSGFRVRLEVFEKGGARRLYVTDKTSPQIEKYQNKTLRFNSKVGIYRPMQVRVMADVNNVVRESNEKNNPTFRVR